MQLQFTVHGDKEKVLDFLINAQKFVSAHPLVYKMEQLDEATYKVFEKVKLASIPYNFVYKAVITQNKNTNTVTIKANIKGLTKIEMIFHLSQLNANTLIKETVTIKSCLPVAFFMHKLIRKQHAILFQNIENQLT